MQDVGKILPAIFRKHLLNPRSKLSDVLVALWPRVAGKSIAKHSRPIGFEGGVLILAVSCPSWAVQLRKMAEEIQAEVNRFVGGPVVKKLKVQLVASLEPVGLPDTPKQLASAVETSKGPLEDISGKSDSVTARILLSSSAKNLAQQQKRKKAKSCL